jgi:hypothetical protein
MAAMNDAPTPRQAWAAVFCELLEHGPWLAAPPRPAGREALIKAFAGRMLGKPDCPNAPEKAVRTWLNGAAPYSKAFELICLVALGDAPANHPRYTELRDTWEAARKSRKANLLDSAEPTRRTSNANPPGTISELAWASAHAWQTTGLAVLFVDSPAFQNERDAYRFKVSVSLGTVQFTIDGRTFSVGLTDAWLEPQYRNCHPVPGSAPGETEPHDHIIVAGGRYQFKGPKPDGPVLYGNPFGTTPFAEIAWDHPGANDVTLTLSSQRTALEIAPTAGAKPHSQNKTKLIQHYLRATQPRSESGTIHWARATLRGRVRE